MSLRVMEGTPEVVAELDVCIPEFDPPMSAGEIASRLEGKPHLILVALDEEQPVGYKVGFESGPREFYSWIGAVLPSRRREGIAQLLLEAQEAWCRGRGYRRVRVKSREEFHGMVALLKRNGYSVVEVDQDRRIHFSKALGGS